MLLNKILTDKKSDKQLFFIFSFIIILVCLPRFNKQDLFGLSKITYVNENKINKGVIGFSDDMAYVDVVKKIRGEANLKYANAPYLYRILPTYLASILPFNALTSINVLNLLSNVISVWIYLQIFNLLKFSSKIKKILLSLYVFSFPIFYYSTTGLIDPMFAVLFGASIYSLLYFLINKQLSYSVIFFILAILTKESAILLLPAFVVIFIFSEFSPIKKLFYILAILFIYFLVNYIIRNFIVSDTPNYVWLPTIENLIFNLSRKRTYISFAASFGLIGILMLVGFWKFINIVIKNKVRDNSILELNSYSIIQQQYLVLISCLFGYSAFLSYALFSAYFGGNYFIPFYFIMLPLVGFYLQHNNLKIFNISLTNAN